ncbi:hypothetical protein GCM10009119_19600 [Algoriphagus jejuensis]|uniref:SMODS and SLOG-associating 2TM effector domain-containing protein n=1 Tax=Algoriphagus jejuensis TaxID=419934 RepID=A0ABN1MZW7_9BACT
MKINELKEIDLFYQELESRIDSIKSKKSRYLFFHKAARVIVFIAGASITVLTGWDIGSSDKSFNPNNLVLLLSTFVTFAAAIEGLFSFKDKSKSYDIFLFDLRRLRDRICFDYTVSPETYKQNREIHFKEFQKILDYQKAIIEASDSGEE